MSAFVKDTCGANTPWPCHRNLKIGQTPDRIKMCLTQNKKLFVKNFQHHFHSCLSQRLKGGRGTIPNGTWGYFPAAAETYWNPRMCFFFFYSCLPTVFPEWVSPNTLQRYQGTCTWVAQELQSIMCDCWNVTYLERQYTQCVHTLVLVPHRHPRNMGSSNLTLLCKEWQLFTVF